MRRRTWLPPRNPAKGLVFRIDWQSRRRMGSKSGRFCPAAWFGTSQLWTCRAGPVKGHRPGCGGSEPSSRLRHGLRELGEEIVGGLFSRAVDQALAELGQL